MSNTITTDVLIIGAGLAGLSTALSLPDSLHITILSKAALEVCSSHYAQGGIAASLAKEDSVAAHIKDTVVAGAGLCTTDNTAHILGAGQQAIDWLCAQGVPFTQIPLEAQNKTTVLSITEQPSSRLHLTKEGGHGCRRVAHADDATGRHVMDSLTIKARAAHNITILTHHEALELLTLPVSDGLFLEDHEKQYCQGARVFDHNNARQLTVYSRAVVLASGGMGQLFKRASAPNVCVGDGIMMAWQAGCRLANLEFIQFHPTGLALDDSSFLISEALRGEGGRLYCPQTGERFMLAIDERAELAPRDIVARAIAAQIESNGLGYVHLDVSHLPAAFIQAHFPQIYQTLLTLGIDMTVEPIPVAPTAHYSCGGVVTCANGLTDVPGLYAAGEVAYTGLHGANRLASNSLLECVVVGRNIAAHLPHYLNSMPSSDNELNTSPSLTTHHWSTPILQNPQSVVLSPSVSQIQSPERYKAHTLDGLDMAEIRDALKSLMTSHMGITRHGNQLAAALTQIQTWQAWLIDNEYALIHDHHAGCSIAAEVMMHVQLSRQLQLATLVIQSAYQRVESRGGHYRHDYPNATTIPQTSVIQPLVDTSCERQTPDCVSKKHLQHHIHATDACIDHHNEQNDNIEQGQQLAETL